MTVDPDGKVFWENGVYIGDILRGDDGYYEFWPDLKGGSWSEYLLSVLWARLKEMNAPYDKQLEEYFAT